MTRAWRQELADARQAHRAWCDACGAAGNAVAVRAYTYALRPSATAPYGPVAVRDTEQPLQIAVCPRHLRALKQGRVLRTADRALALSSRKTSG